MSSRSKARRPVKILAMLQVSESTLNRRKATYGSMTRPEARELKRLRDENDELKRLLGQAELEKQAWKLLSGGNF